METTRTHRPRIKRGERVSHVDANNVHHSYAVSACGALHKDEAKEMRKEVLEEGREARLKVINKMFSETAVQKAAVTYTSLSDLQERDTMLENHYNGIVKIKFFTDTIEISMSEWREKPTLVDIYGNTYEKWIKKISK